MNYPMNPLVTIEETGGERSVTFDLRRIIAIEVLSASRVRKAGFVVLTDGGHYVDLEPKAGAELFREWHKFHTPIQFHRVSFNERQESPMEGLRRIQEQVRQKITSSEFGKYYGAIPPYVVNSPPPSLKDLIHKGFAKQLDPKSSEMISGQGAELLIIDDVETSKPTPEPITDPFAKTWRDEPPML